MKNKMWIEATHFDRNLNTDARDYCAYITKDMELFFYSNQGEIRFLPTSVFPEELQSVLKR